jgi:hypothetical protein
MQNCFEGTRDLLRPTRSTQFPSDHERGNDGGSSFVTESYGSEKL